MQPPASRRKRKGPGVGEGLLDRFQVRTLLKSNFVSPHTRASRMTNSYFLLGASLRSAKKITRHSARLRLAPILVGRFFLIPFATLTPIVRIPRILRYAQNATGNDFLYSDDWNDEAKPRSGMRNVSLRKLDYILLYYPRARSWPRACTHVYAREESKTKRKPHARSRLAHHNDPGEKKTVPFPHP